MVHHLAMCDYNENKYAAFNWFVYIVSNCKQWPISRYHNKCANAVNCLLCCDYSTHRLLVGVKRSRKDYTIYIKRV